MTPDKYHSRNNTSNILYATTNNVPPLIKYPIYPQNVNKPHYEVSEATETGHSRGDKKTEHTKDK